MPDLDYAKVMQRLGLTVGDGADPDETPDTIWCDGGTVQIVPLNTYVKVADGSPVPWTGGNAVIECTVTGDDFVDLTGNGFDGAGYLLFNGKPFVWVVDLSSPKVNPTVTEGATHRINYVGMTADGTAVSFPSVDVRITAAGDGVSPDGFNDLTILSPVVPGTATPIYRGETGTGIASLAVTGLGELEVELTDGSTVNAGELPVGPGGSDAGVAGYIATPGSATGTALSASIADGSAPRSNLVSQLPSFFLASHRSAGLLYPEHSREGDEASVQAGYAIETDVRALADGTLVCNHDTTVDRTTTGTGNVSALTREQWDALRLRPVLPGTADSKPMYFLDWLDVFGGRAVLFVEIKDTSPQVVEDVLAAIEERRLQKSVIVNSFVWDNLLDAASRGMAAMYSADNVGKPGGKTYAEVRDAGIEWVNVSTAVSQADIEALVAEGFNVAVYLVNRMDQLVGRRAWGARVVATDDPWRLDRKYPATSMRERFDQPYLPPGGAYSHVQAPIRHDAALGGLVSELVDANTTPLSDVGSGYMIGRAGYGPQVGTRVRFKAQALPTIGGTGIANATERNTSAICEVFIGVKPDGAGAHTTATDERWARAVFRRNGTRTAYDKPTYGTGTVNQLGQQTAARPTRFSAQATDTTTLVDGGPEHEYEVEVTSTSLILRCLTSPDPDLTVAYTPITDDLDSFVTIRTRAASSVIRDVRVYRSSAGTTPGRIATSVGVPDGWISYTPTISGVTIGDGTIEGKYRWVGRDAIEIIVRVVLGSTSVVASGKPSVSLPLTHLDAPSMNTNVKVMYYDASNTAYFPAAGAIGNSLTLMTAAGASLSATVPFAWAVADQIGITASYPVG